jgi:hypothetical protein
MVPSKLAHALLDDNPTLRQKLADIATKLKQINYLVGVPADDLDRNLGIQIRYFACFWDV